MLPSPEDLRCGTKPSTSWPTVFSRHRQINNQIILPSFNPITCQCQKKLEQLDKISTKVKSIIYTTNFASTTKKSFIFNSLQLSKLFITKIKLYYLSSQMTCIFPTFFQLFKKKSLMSVTTQVTMTITTNSLNYPIKLINPHFTTRISTKCQLKNPTLLTFLRKSPRITYFDKLPRIYNLIPSKQHFNENANKVYHTN